MDVVDERGAEIGKVTAVQNFGAGDILEISRAGAERRAGAVHQGRGAGGRCRGEHDPHRHASLPVLPSDADDDGEPTAPSAERRLRSEAPAARAARGRRQPVSFRASVLTLYPEMFPGPLGLSLAGRALEAGTWSLEAVQIRDFASRPASHRRRHAGRRRRRHGDARRHFGEGDRPCLAARRSAAAAADEPARQAADAGARCASWPPGRAR